MNLEPGALILGLVAGSIGVGYFVYGRRQRKPMFLVAGIALCVMPYLVTGVGWCIAACVVATLLPHLVRA